MEKPMPWWHHPHVRAHFAPTPRAPLRTAPSSTALPARPALHRSKMRFVVHVVVALFFVKVLLVAVVFQVAVSAVRANEANTARSTPSPAPRTSHTDHTTESIIEAPSRLIAGPSSIP